MPKNPPQMPESAPQMPTPPSSSQGKISTYLAPNEPLGLVLARLAALDRIPFKTIANSHDIIAGLRSRGFQGYLGRNAIRLAVIGYANEIKDQVKQNIQQKLKQDLRFSLSLDEYTSAKNRRYMCINLHDGTSEVICLGMARVEDSMPAEKAVQLVKNKLADFGLVVESHIFGVVSDGASVMKRFVRILGTEHQVCHAHGLHLAICDTLYKTSQEDVEVNLSGSNVQEEEGDPAVDVESDEEVEEDGGFQEEQIEAECEISEEIGAIIKKIRRICKLFRRSPVKNDTLQKY